MPTAMRTVTIYAGGGAVTVYLSATDFATFKADATNHWANGGGGELVIPANAVAGIPEQHIAWSSVARYTVS